MQPHNSQPKLDVNTTPPHLERTLWYGHPDSIVFHLFAVEGGVKGPAIYEDEMAPDVNAVADPRAGVGPARIEEGGPGFEEARADYFGGWEVTLFYELF